MKQGLLILASLAITTGGAHAADLCRANPYTKAEAVAGKVAFDSHCALCHQYDMTGRVPGNHEKESPDIGTLSPSDLEFLDHGGGNVPPLLGAKFMQRMSVEKPSIAAFSSYVAGAANSFPPKGKVEIPLTYFQIAAYVLYRNCGKL